MTEAYSSLPAFYDRLTGDVPYMEFADFIEAIFAEYGVEAKILLDLACGTGTLMRIMAERGYDMIGVDTSWEMLSAAREKAEGLDPAPLLLCQPAEELDLYGTVDAAVCTLDGVNYMHPDTIGEVFRRVHLFLEPGGVFVFDINSEYKLRGLDGGLFIDETEDVYCVWRTEYLEEERACLFGIDLFTREGGLWRRSGEEHVEYAYSLRELKTRLSAAGFQSIRFFGDRAMTEPAGTEARVFVAAQKSGER